MKKIYLFFVLFSFLNCYSQNSYEKEFEEAKLYVKEVFKNNPSEILNYVKLSDGKIKLCKTDNPIKEFDNDWSMFYKILRKNDKIVYISKSDDLWGGIGDSKTSYDYYFNEKGTLVGAEKISEFFLEDTKCTPQIKYYALYKNVNAEKLDKTETFRNIEGKIIDFNSTKCKGIKKTVDNSIGYLDRITFRDVEGFMKAENIKYYTDSGSNNIDKKESEKRREQSNNLRLFGSENLKKFTFMENYMDSLEINKKLNDEVYIESEPSKKIVKIKREKLAKKQYKTVFDLYEIGKYSCISEIPVLDNGLFMKINRFYDEERKLFSFTEIDGVVNEKGERINRISRFCLLKNDNYNYGSEVTRAGLVSRKYYKNETEINNDEFDLLTKNSNIKSYTERFGKIDRNALSDYQNERDEKNKKIVKYSTVGLQTLLNLIVK